MKIVLVDDNYAIRQLIKSILGDLDNSIEIFSSSDGIEGLGLVYTINPDLIILDTTLPKYSGKEVYEFLLENNGYANQIIIISQSKEYQLKNISCIDKSSYNFHKQLTQEIQKKLGLNTSEVHRPNSKTKVIDHLIRIANKKDEFEYRFEQSSLAKKILTRIFLTILDLYQALLLGLVLIFGTKLKDSNIQQNDLDLRRYRVKYYPTVTTIGISFIILLSQLFLYVTGGIIILNTKVISIFAIGDGDSEILFVDEEIDNFIFDEQFIEFDANGASLVEIQEPQADEPPTPTEILPTEIIIEPSIAPTDIPNPTNEAIPSVEPSEVPTNTPIQSPHPTDIPEVLGANTEEQTEVAYQYPSTSPELVTKNGIEYSYLESIVEQSEINNEQTSTQTDSEYQVNSATNISISYQLSPDSESWYYYDATELIWERTDQAVSSSNSIQEINQNLDSYNDQFGAGELFFKIFLISDGSEDITINSLIVSKEDSLLASNEDYSPETSEVDQLANIDDSLLIDTEPVLFNANYFNGHKVVKGKLLPKDDTLSRVIDIDESILTDYQANIYFSDSQSATKGELIGTTDLYLNQRGEIEFFLSEPSSPGGFVTAEIVNKNSDFTSELAKPLKNATFVIDTTLDLYDAGDTDNVGFVDNPDGLCDDGTGYCSMRAAVFESNNNSEADVLSFDIPYSDPGYLDYDGGPGDIPANGDDFWQMKPSLINTESYSGYKSSYFLIKESGLNLNGDTQAANRGVDSNIFGPDIEIDGSIMTTSSNNSAWQAILFATTTESDWDINAITLNNKVGINFKGSNFEITNSHIGVDSKGLVKKPSSTEIWLSGTLANIHIGNTSSDGNVLANNGSYGIFISSVCDSVKISGNLIGVKKDLSGAFPLPNHNNGSVYISGACNSIIGGDTPEEGNIIAGNQTFQFTGGSAAPYTIEVYNNFLNTDPSASQTYFGGSRGIWIRSADPNRTIIIGAPGKGNFFAGVSYGIHAEGNGELIVENNTFSGNINNNYNSGGGINFYGTAGATTPITIKNNYFGASDSDPYFGLKTIGGSYGINNGVDGDITIEGNFFNQNSFGIVQTVGNAVTRQDVSNDIHPGFTRVGGTNALTGSLCNGIEENCFDKNIVAGFYSIDTTINNKSTILSENDFSYGNGSDNNQSVLEVWKGTFEIFSNEHRRTDLTPASIDIDFIPQITTDYYTAFFPSYEVIGYVNNTPQCLELSASCPDDLSTANNNENTSIVGLYLDVAGTPYNLGTLGAPYYSYYWPHMPTGTYQIDTPHFASQEFSFDGDATTDPIDGYPSRDLGGVFYSDRGEPWTDLSGLDSKSLERFQIMEVELVDGNPVKQQDNSFIITVDVATDNQDNVSNSGYDDGSGVYSGGGNEGPDGLANGETTLREAILVANSHPGLDKIEFASGVTTIALTSPLPEITDPIFIDGKKTVIIDGTSAGSTNGFTINSSGSTIQNLTIKNFSGNGISILSGTNNKISRNSIYQNNQLGIDLNNDGVTANDVLDNDTGANNLQNYPVIAAAGKGSILLVGSINSQPNTNYVIEFFYNQNKDTSGYGEGEIFVGDLAVATDANGNASFQTTYDYPAEVGKYMTATLTDPSGNTSEFSQAVQISLAPDAVDDNVSTPGQVIIDVLSNDSDLDGSLDLNTLKIIVDPQHGTVIINYENGTITYIPDPGYFGIDSFTYIICDNTGLCDTAVVNINVIQDLNPKDTPIITATPSLANTVAPTVGIELIDLPKTGSGASTNNLFNTYLALIPLMGAILTAVLVYPRAILYALLWLKRPHNPVWGQTLNDDKAIKFVKIQLKRYGELYAETISNSNGEYGFQVPAGDYVLKTTHPAFVTFNKNIRVKNSKEYNLNIEIHKKNFSKETSFRNIYFRTREIILRSLHNINATLFMIGLIWSIFATYRYPILFNVLIMLIYLVLIIWNTLSSDLYFKAFHKNNS